MGRIRGKTAESFAQNHTQVRPQIFGKEAEGLREKGEEMQDSGEGMQNAGE